MPTIRTNPTRFEISTTPSKVLTIADIKSVRAVKEGLQINFLENGKTKLSEVFDITMPEFVVLVEGAKGDLKELGEYHYSGVNNLIYPRIALLREDDNTTYANICPLCSSTSKVYHQGCNCSLTKPFDGEIEVTEYGLAHAITRQLVVISHPEMNKLLNLKTNRFDLNESIRKVTHIHKEKGVKGIFGYVKIRDQSILVHSDELEGGLNIEPSRYYWTAVEASQMNLVPELYERFINLIKADNSIYYDEERVLISVIDGCKNFPDILEFEMWLSNENFVYNNKQFELEYDESDDTWAFITLCSNHRVKSWIRFE